jgi:hypothetical protein
MTNLYEINDLVDFLSDHQITANQFMYCLLLYHDKKYSRIPGSSKISRPISQLFKYHNNVKNFTRGDLEDLVDKGFVISKDNKFVPDLLDISDKFVKLYLGPKYKLDQLLEVYPTWVTNFDHPGKHKINLKIMSDYESLVQRYNKLIKTDKMHNRVIELVEWANNENQINLGIEKFVASKYWEFLFELRNTSEVGSNYEVIS